MIKERLREGFPNILANLLTRKLLCCFAEFIPEFLVGLGASGETNDRDCWWELTVSGNVVQGRNQFAMGQIAGCAEDNDRAWLRHSPRAQTFTQWICLFRHLCHVERSRDLLFLRQRLKIPRIR